MAGKGMGWPGADFGGVAAMSAFRNAAGLSFMDAVERLYREQMQ